LYSRLLIFLICFAGITRCGFAQVGFPYCESFTDQLTIGSETVFGGNAKIVDGALRLTDAKPQQSGYVYIDIPFSPTYGIKASFEYFMYGGTGADGLTVFLFDAAVPDFSPGGSGGALGYAQLNEEQGLSGGYLGLGFDGYGNYSNSGEGKVGGFFGGSTSLFPNSITLRKGGSGLTGYDFVIGKMTDHPITPSVGLDVRHWFPLSSGGLGTERVTDPNQVGYRKVFLELEPHPSGSGYLFKLEMEVTTVSGQPRLITIFPGNAFNYEAPENLKIGFAASTGNLTNIHEIRNLLVEVSNDERLQNPTGVDLLDFTSCEGQENPFDIEEEGIVLPNESSTIRCIQFYQSEADIAQESDDSCSQGKCREENRELVLPEGVFRAGATGGGFTFFPNEGYIGEEVMVYYTIIDNFGKSSSGNVMKIAIQNSPEPVTITVANENKSPMEVRLCGGENVTFIANGGETYERYEWYENGEVIEDATERQFTAITQGEYSVWAYNPQNCPAISNTIKVSFPEFPDFKIPSPIIACTPGEPVDVTAFIADYDPVTFNYRLTGNGEEHLNDELKAIFNPGKYEIQIKHADLECYSSPELVEIIISKEGLIADFDFEVVGTGVKGEEDGGFFPDDEFQLTDRSVAEALSWSWDFGDGQVSGEKSPVHVFGKKGEFDVKLTIKNELGCETSKIRRISIWRSYRLMFPTGFTPLAGENQFFVPKFKGLTSCQLLVFNLWGDLIFESEGIDMLGWDGKLNGKLLDAGIYVYRFNGVAIDGEKVVSSGKFKLIR